MPLERDIIEKIKQTFPPDDEATAIELLDASGAVGRGARCMVFLAGGSLERLKQWIKSDEHDWRNVFLAAEYDDRRRIRCFADSFLIDEPRHFWILPVVSALASRGYVLSSIQTAPASDFDHYNGNAEGVATFEGDLGTIWIVRTGRQWFLKGDRTDLEIYGLEKGFEDANEFADRISGYILTKRRPLKRS